MDMLVAYFIVITIYRRRDLFYREKPECTRGEAGAPFSSSGKDA
jgi:hypothetical protein